VLAAERVFYRKWILANGWSEAAGLGTTFVLGRLVAPSLERLTGVAVILAGALAAVVLGALLEGVLVGFAQERVLRRRLAELPPWSWVMATAAGAGLAWLLGMLPSTFIALSSDTSAGPPPTPPGPLLQYALAAAMGLVVGPILGAVQSLVLRRFVQRPWRWLGANGLAWAVGMPLIFLGMDFVPWTAGAVAVVASLYGVCAVSGLVVGAIHGGVLVQLVRIPKGAEQSR
jgi:hypothetical protein